MNRQKSSHLLFRPLQEDEKAFQDVAFKCVLCGVFLGTRCCVICGWKMHNSRDSLSGIAWGLK